MKLLARTLFLIVVAWLTGAAPSRAQTYTATADAATQLAYPWIDISTTGTQVALADDGVSGDLPIGFTFTFGSTPYTTVNVTANGMLQFGTATSGSYTNSTLPLTGSNGEPNIDAAMLPLWDDLNADGSGGYIRYRTLGVAPNRVFVMSWLAIPYYCSNSGSTCDSTRRQTRTIFATFQVQIYEQGHFVYRYGPVDGSGGAHTSGPTVSNPLGASVGYELTNSDYSQYSYRVASEPNNRTILWQRPAVQVTPGGFNAFDTGTAAGSITGYIRTKIAGTAFNLAVVALNTARTAVQTTFTGDVKVELLDTSDNTGALNATTGCRSSWTTVLASTTLTFGSTDAGRATLSQAQANSWRDVRLRISYPATGTPTVTGCSTDNFAIRPDRFVLATGATSWASDADWSTIGNARQLDTTTSTGGRVHRAGQPFTLRAVAVNSASTTTANYTGTPGATLSACSGTGCTATFGTLSATLTATAGVINASATYTEAGAFNLQLTDTTFAAVDASDGSTAAEQTISSTATAVGRFVPNHFEIVSLQTPVLRTFNSTCSSRSFTYLGQPFGYATLPQASVLARNAAGSTTTLYANSKWTASGVGVSSGYTPLASATPGLDSSAASPPTLTAVGSGTARIDGASDTLTMVRSATTPSAPFNAAITLTWSVSDSSESSITGNGTITTITPLSYSPIGFNSGSEFRYGQLRMGSTFGSELVALPVPLELQYWNGTAFVTNVADQCTALATSALSLANYRGNLAACETAPTASSLTFSSGRAVMRLKAAGDGNRGSVDGTLQLGSSLVPTTAVRCAASPGATSSALPAGLPWLQGKAAGGTTYDQNPSARFTFGQSRTPLIQLRELY